MLFSPAHDEVRQVAERCIRERLHPRCNKSPIIVPMKTPGVSVTRKIRKPGLHASDTAQIHVDVPSGAAPTS